MPPRKKEGSNLKRGLPPATAPEVSEVSKRRRRSERLSQKAQDGGTPLKTAALPSPYTHTSSLSKDGTVTPPTSSAPKNKNQLLSPSSPEQPLSQYYGYGDSQTQPFSQVIYPPPTISYEVDDEETDDVWGYLVPVDEASDKYGILVLKERGSCDKDDASAVGDSMDSKRNVGGAKKGSVHSRGYLVGRHPECDLVINVPTVSNRHFLIFAEYRAGNTFALLEDTSGNGTFVNNVLVGRNNRRELHDGDEISILDEARFSFRYPRHRKSSAFNQQYVILDQLGKGHFATVYLCIDKASGCRWAVKKFDKSKEKNKLDGIKQEIAVLMSISHPSLLCMKGAFDEDDGVYLILELAPEGELFNWIVMKQKLTEAECRKVFIQLFQAVKYLHERNIVHRDIKPENILLADTNLTIKLADFGLAKIIGEESFTTTLCGTPSYVAPEILQPTKKRRYTRAVDIWSLGVVLYICLCGFPPFSDELYSPENPYTLAQQILGGRYDYPSPYWDSVGDPALMLIDRMLTIDPEQRIAVDECLEHPWITGRPMGPAGESVLSTDGLLAGRMDQLDFSKRKPLRERTLLSALNEVHVRKVVAEDSPPRGRRQPPVSVFEKNRDVPSSQAPRSDDESQAVAGAVNDDPSEAQDTAATSAARFLLVGEGGDESLYSTTDSKERFALFKDDSASVYPVGDSAGSQKD